MKPLLYLASPYTAKTPSGVLDTNTMSLRASLAAVAAARIVDMGVYYVYSPIIHNHSVNQHLRIAQPSWDFWGPVDIHFLRFADALGVLMLEGWEDSTGVQEELRFAKLIDMPVEWIQFDTDNKIRFLKHIEPMFEVRT